mmetsp:Transcript_63792/g.113933  ORF Transcript_63792/g.113933 Transcript_63792/m.113933 type:complete len:81 (-) Transcript_63792:123-365(-)
MMTCKTDKKVQGRPAASHESWMRKAQLFLTGADPGDQTILQPAYPHRAYSMTQQELHPQAAGSYAHEWGAGIYQCESMDW